MDFFKRIGARRDKFKVQFFIGQLTSNALLKGQIYLVIKRGQHKVTSMQKCQMDQNKKCDFKKEILTFDSLTLFYDQDDKKYQEKQGQIRVIMLNKKQEKKLLGIINFDVGDYANQQKQNLVFKQTLKDSPQKVNIKLQFQVFIKYIGQASEASKSKSSLVQKKQFKKDLSLSKFGNFVESIFNGNEKSDKQDKSEKQIEKQDKNKKNKSITKNNEQKGQKKKIKFKYQKTEKNKNKKNSSKDSRDQQQFQQEEEGQNSKRNKTSKSPDSKKSKTSNTFKTPAYQSDSYNYNMNSDSSLNNINANQNKNQKMSKTQKQTQKQRVNSNTSASMYTKQNKSKVANGNTLKEEISKKQFLTDRQLTNQISKKKESKQEKPFYFDQEAQVVNKEADQLNALFKPQKKIATKEQSKNSDKSDDNHQIFQNKTKKQESDKESNKKLAQLLKENERLKQENDKLKSQKSKFIQNQSKMNEEINRLKKLHFQKSQSFSQKQRQTIILSRKQQELQQKVLELEKQKGQFLIKMQKMQQYCKKLQIKKQQDLQQKQDQKAMLDEQSRAQLKRLKDQINTLKYKIQKLETQKGEMKGNNQKLSKQNKQIQQEYQKLQKQLSTLKNRICQQLNQANQDGNRTMMEILANLND